MIKFDEIESAVTESRKGPDRGQPNLEETAVGPDQNRLNRFATDQIPTIV